MADPALPTIAEILASTEVLSPPDANSTVVKVREFAVKYGHRVSLLEAETMEYLADTAVPLPKLYASMSNAEGDQTFIVMELLEGQSLDKALPSLTAAERHDIFEQIGEALTQLRNLPPPDYIGSIGRRALGDGIFFTKPVDPSKSGPFASQDDMNEGIVRLLNETNVPSYVKLLRSMIESTLQGHRIVFTHADLQPKNIMVCRKGDKEGGNGGVYQVKIVDWEMSGWYPEYYEFCNATVWNGFHPEWLEAVQDMMTLYPKEYLMMKALRGALYFG